MTVGVILGLCAVLGLKSIFAGFEAEQQTQRTKATFVCGLCAKRVDWRYGMYESAGVTIQTDSIEFQSETLGLYVENPLKRK